MDRNQKFLNKLTPHERQVLTDVLLLLKANRLSTLDIKKMSGHPHYYRIRVGTIRIIFKKVTDLITIEQISRRDDQTYKDF
jgi:mRNA-degrading endonuclease RelE of RelBE toxin-antitoxin system